MSGFFDVKSGGLTTIGLYVSAAMVLVGGGITIFHGGGAGGDRSTVDFYYKCLNCQDTQTLSQEEFVAFKDRQNEDFISELEESDPEAAAELRGMLDGSIKVMMPGSITPNWGTPGAEYPCGECGENSVLMALKCPKDGEIFISYDNQGQPSDKCTKCGYSKKQEKHDKWKEERDKERNRNRKNK